MAIVVSDSETFWLNVTNIGLGLVVLVCLLVVGLSVVRELAQRRKRRVALSRELDRDLKTLVAEYEADPRIFQDPALGPTMADGGEDIDRLRGNDRH